MTVACACTRARAPRADAGQEQPRSRLPVRAVLPVTDGAALVLGGFLAAGSTPAVAVYSASVLLVLAASGAHRLRICLRSSDELPRLVLAAAAPVATLLPWLTASAALRTVLLCGASLLVARIACAIGLVRARSRGRLREPTLIIGTGATAVELALLLREHPELGLAPAGFLDDRPPQRESLPVLGCLAELPDVVATHRIRRVIVSFASVGDTDLVGVLRAVRPFGVDVTVVPRLHELGMAVPRYRLDDVWGIPLLPLRAGKAPGVSLVKRFAEPAVAAILLVLLAPLLLALAGLVLTSAGRPVLFRQARLGRGGMPIVVPKLRTVVLGHDAPGCWHPPSGELTTIGRWLRSTHLDELPQLCTVLCGRMSLVGPRPERADFAQHFDRTVPRYPDRRRIRPGITGWAQVHGLHGDTSIPERARFDNQYIEYWSPWLDVVILARTFGAALITTQRRDATVACGGGAR